MQIYIIKSTNFFEIMAESISGILDETLSEFNDTDDASETKSNMKHKKCAEIVCTNFNLAPSRICKFGERCRERMQCSYIHSTESGLEKAFCYCEDAMCIKPHPNRRKMESRKRKRMVCKNCSGDHPVTECPRVKCYNCNRYGHLANNCTMQRRSHAV